MLLCRTLKPSLLAATLAGRYAPTAQRSVRGLAAQLPPRLVIREQDIEEQFLKGSGPGGQKIVRFNASYHLLRSANSISEPRTKLLLLFN